MGAQKGKVADCAGVDTGRESCLHMPVEAAGLHCWTDRTRRAQQGGGMGGSSEDKATWAPPPRRSESGAKSCPASCCGSLEARTGPPASPPGPG